MDSSLPHNMNHNRETDPEFFLSVGTDERWPRVQERVFMAKTALPKPPYVMMRRQQRTNWAVAHLNLQG